MSEPAAAFKSLFVFAKDGLRLHTRDYGQSSTPGTPVICLPGLSRSAADFDCIARALSEGSAGQARRVLALDYRGRGLSAYDPNWQNYQVPIEQADILAVLEATGIEKAIFIGTSRGGIHIMVLAATHPELLQAAVLNDIGPVLETKGLTRIRGYVGKFPPPRNLPEAVALLKTINGTTSFSGLDEADWEAYAKATYCNEEGQWGSRYDPQLMRQTDDWNEETPAPELWREFDCLRDVPLLVIRGQNSDLFSEASLAEMRRHVPGLESCTIAGQGHAPLLMDAFSIAMISQFVKNADAR